MIKDGIEEMEQEENRLSARERLDRWSHHALWWCQFRLSAIVCAILGHIEVDPSAMWVMLRGIYDKDVDKVCLRCGKQTRSLKALVDNFYAKSPLFKKIEFLDLRDCTPSTEPITPPGGDKIECKEDGPK